MYEVTIGIPVYNVEKYIRLTMDSALAQTFQSIEFLVLDDCGTDSSIEIVRHYQKNHPRGRDVRIVRQQKNSGIGNVRNRIIDEACGKYLFFLDGDDSIAPYTIELLYKQAIQYDADIVYGSYERIEEFNGPIKRIPYKYPDLRFLKEHEFADYVYNDYGFLQAPVWNFLIKVDIFRSNNIRFNAVNFWEDFSLTIDLPTYIDRAVMLSDITYYYYCRNESLSNFSKRSRIEKCEIMKTIRAMGTVKQNSERVKSKPYYHKRMFKVMLTHFYMACTILKDKNIIYPSFSNSEIRNLMLSPLSLGEILMMKDWRFKNLCLYLLGILPPTISVTLMKILGKYKKLI